MPLPDAVSLESWADEEYLSAVLETDFSLLEIFRDQVLVAHDERCDRIARNVMSRIAELPPPRRGE
jgi:hypothetical protein